MGKTILFSARWYEQRVHLGVLRYAQEQKWDVVSSHHMPDLAYHVPDVDGQIVQIGPRDRRRLKVTVEYKGPVVGLEDFGDGLKVPRVHTNNLEIGKLAARHLLDCGFRRFVTVSQSDHQYERDRLEGFHDEIAKEKETRCLDTRSRVPGESRNTLPKDQDDSPFRILQEQDRPLGVFCTDDDDAGGVIRFLDKKQVAVPEEIAVIGVNNDPLICPYASVPISSVDPGFEKIGYKAAELLDRMMQGKTVPVRTHTIKPTGVVARRSSDIQAVEDVLVAKALRFVWDNADKWVSISDIAEYVDLPVRTLQWKFSKRMGRSLQDELTKSRIEQVKHQLVHTAKSANRIAADLNFSSVQYMIKVFSKETGFSPLKYRRLHTDPSS